MVPLIQIARRIAISLAHTTVFFSLKFFNKKFFNKIKCFFCRKPEVFREAAVAPRVVPEGGGPLPALAEGARA